MKDTSLITLTFAEMYDALRSIELHTRNEIKSHVESVMNQWKDTRVSEDDLILIFEQILKGI